MGCQQSLCITCSKIIHSKSLFSLGCQKCGSKKNIYYRCRECDVLICKDCLPEGLKICNCGRQYFTYLEGFYQDCCERCLHGVLTKCSECHRSYYYYSKENSKIYCEECEALFNGCR